MSKEVKTQESEIVKSNKKYIVLAIVVILAIIGIMSGNSKEDETATTTVATTEQAPVAEQAPVTEQAPVVEETHVEVEPTVGRIDITTPLVNADEPQFEVYVDDSNTPEKQTAWMPKFGNQGYAIQRNANSTDIIIDVLKDNNLEIFLRGPDKRDENKQFIPVWVDYTSLVINGEEILQEPVSVWHNKPFIHNINVKAGDEIKVNAKWQKHNEE